jgi:hypothetical protein
LSAANNLFTEGPAMRAPAATVADDVINFLLDVFFII